MATAKARFVTTPPNEGNDFGQNKEAGVVGPSLNAKGVSIRTTLTSGKVGVTN